MDASYWVSLAEDYLTAYAQAFPSAGGIASEPSHRNAIVIAISVAEHETNNGRAWPGTNNFGAVQLRGLTLQEQTAFEAGELKAGDYTPTRDGVLHVDTHPTPSGPKAYPVWFAAFPDRVAGIAHFLKTLWRLSGGQADEDSATCATVAHEMYRHGYYEGSHAGARAVYDAHAKLQRTDPLTPPEQANVDDYARSTQACRDRIEPDLVGWDYALEVPANDGGPDVAEPDIPDPAA